MVVYIAGVVPTGEARVGNRKVDRPIVGRWVGQPVWSRSWYTARGLLDEFHEHVHGDVRGVIVEVNVDGVDCYVQEYDRFAVGWMLDRVYRHSAWSAWQIGPLVAIAVVTEDGRPDVQPDPDLFGDVA